MTFPLTLPWPAAADETSPDLALRAGQIAQRALIVDTHIDVPYRLQQGWADVTGRTDDGDFDYERAQQGGLDIAFMSIFTPAKLETEGGSFKLANQLIDSAEALAGRAPKKFAVVGSTSEALEAQKLGLVGLALGMENGAPLEGDLGKLRFFHDRGVRYITLAHSLSNHICDSSYDENRPWGGLSPFGREVVAEMNRLGIMVDISHVSDEAFWDVIGLTRAPVIASHSSARHFTPGFERNMSDDMILALAKAGGVIQINFGSSFITVAANEWFENMKAAREAWDGETGLDPESEKGQEWMRIYREVQPFPHATVSDVADHFDHVVKLVGHAHVGIGSDFDGAGDSLPDGLKDVSAYPALFEEFLKRGYSEEQIEAIAGGNLMRVWAEVEKVADS